MSSDLKTETARTNGAKSKGPITPEGRAKSARNSTRHGLTAKSVVLPAESEAQFEDLRQAYVEKFEPENPVEIELVDIMAIARWRLRRMVRIESSLLANELARRSNSIDEEFINTSADDRLAWVFQSLADYGQSLSLIPRYEASLGRAHDRALKQLHLLRFSADQKLRNEPSEQAQ